MTPLATQFGFEPIEEAILIDLGILAPRPFSVSEIASIYGVKRQTIDYVLKRAYQKIEPVLEEYR